LDFFYQWGSATGLMPTLKFPEVRQFLLNLLKDCAPGQWYSTESLIAYLKANHPHFLIPHNVPKTDKWGKTITRYGNFYEGKDSWVHNEKPIPDNAPDGFERVEGRYVERFLEGIPLTMRFVDVAYNPAPYKGLLPTRGMLKAFRVSERFLNLMNGQESQPRLTVQPNFDVIVESDFYPTKIIQQIAALGEDVSSPTSGHSAYVGLFQLKKNLVAAEQVRLAAGKECEVARAQRDFGRGRRPEVALARDHHVGARDRLARRHRHAPRLVRGGIQRHCRLEIREPQDLRQGIHKWGQTPIRSMRTAIPRSWQINLIGV